MKGIIAKLRAFWWANKVAWDNRHLFDMPKKQPCPSCRGQAKRMERLIGAGYSCSKCKLEFNEWKRVVLK